MLLQGGVRLDVTAVYQMNTERENPTNAELLESEPQTFQSGREVHRPHSRWVEVFTPSVLGTNFGWEIELELATTAWDRQPELQLASTFDQIFSTLPPK